MRMKSVTERKVIPRKTAEQIGEALDSWRREHGVVQRELAGIAKVSQPQVSRILAGNFRYADSPVLRLCAAAGIECPSPGPAKAGQALRRRLHAELDRCWDGSKSGAEALIELLRAAGRIGAGRSSTGAAAAD